MKLKAFVAQLCLTLRYPMDCSLPGSSVHGTVHVRILEWVVILFSRGSSWTRDWAWVSHIAGRFFTIWATREAHFIEMEAHSRDPDLQYTCLPNCIISHTIIKDIKSVECKIMGKRSSLVVQWLRICLATGDMGSTPGWRTKIPHAEGQLSLCAATTEHSNQLEKLACHCEGPACHKTWHSQIR